ncbi:hypothetical protein [Agrococcus casei]|uniref:hypothetical protein n=1 Tax=Agrococcus casei TaxID=343512 RepID=UPI003F911F0D
MRSKRFVWVLAAVFILISIGFGTFGMDSDALGGMPLLRWSGMLLIPLIAIIALLVLGRKKRSDDDQR